MEKMACRFLLIGVIFSLVGMSLGTSPNPVRAGSLEATPTNQFVAALAYEESLVNLDPALSFYQPSDQILDQIYEPLVTYNREKADEFVPQLAESWEISTDKATYVFHIRPDVIFQNGAPLSTEDVAYTFQRGILQGGTGSPQLMFTEPFLGKGITDITGIVDGYASVDDRDLLKLNPSEDLLQACETVKSKIVADEDAGTVTMTLAQPWSPLLATLAASWGSILSKAWVIAQGGWNGACDTWQNYYAMQPAEDPLTRVANGTGPFSFDHWTDGVEIGLVKNPAYWRTTPLWPGGPSGLAAFDEVIFRQEISPQDTADKLISGEIDFATISPEYYTVVEPEVFARHDADGRLKSLGDPDGRLSVYDGLRSVTLWVGLFNYAIPPTSPFIGSGTWGTGIPTLFFTDIHVRKAFNYAFNWEEYVSQAFGGYALQLYGFIPQGVIGYSDEQPHFTYDPASASAEINQAFDGAVSANGFSMTCAYNQAKRLQQFMCELIKAGVEALNPAKFHVESLALSGEDYSYHYQNGNLPIYIGGWIMDILHPFNSAQPYLIGTNANRQHLPQAIVDKYFLKLSACLELLWEDERLCYEDIQSNVFQDSLDISLAQPISRVYTRPTLNGYYYNQIKNLYVYALSKDSTVTPGSDTPVAFMDSLGNQANMVIPAGSTIEPVQLAILPDVPLQDLGGNQLATGPAFVLQGYRLSDGTPVTLRFSSGVPLTIKYLDSLVQEETLRLYYWNGMGWEDASCGEYVRNLAENTITVPICHLSQFEMGGNTQRVYLPLIQR
ncbi:MAG TPA: ABC transporter substrate-binding protein [Anaerolineaceae bacterium]|nr:ABC transporter substrate-binding protein [Anaerolineaceae bacterium]